MTRVVTVCDALIQAGAPSDRIETGTFGTDRFTCNPSTEQCSQREGRVEVLVRATNKTAAVGGSPAWVLRGGGSPKYRGRTYEINC